GPGHLQADIAAKKQRPCKRYTVETTVGGVDGVGGEERGGRRRGQQPAQLGAGCWHCTGNERRGGMAPLADGDAADIAYVERAASRLCGGASRIDRTGKIQAVVPARHGGSARVSER